MKNDIDKGIRLVNYIIDTIVLFVFFILINVIFIPSNPSGVFLCTQFTYYFIFESISGQTLGKLATNTEVLSIDNTKPNVGKILIRSILRLVPIDGYSYLFGQDQGGHDIMSRTRLRKVDNGI